MKGWRRGVGLARSRTPQALATRALGDLRMLGALLTLSALLAFAAMPALAFSSNTKPGAPSKRDAAQAKKRTVCRHHAKLKAHHARRCKRHVAAKPSTPASLVKALPGAFTGQPALTPTPATAIAAAPTAAPAGPVAPAEVPAVSEPPVEPPAEQPIVEPPAIPHVQVSAVEYSFSLSRTTVPAGKVIMQFVNDGQDAHNLHIDQAGEGAEAGAFPNTPSKGIGQLELELQPGSYTLLCSLPTHEAKGMKATLTVE